MGLLFWSVCLSIIGVGSTFNIFIATVGGRTFLYGDSPITPDQKIDWILERTGLVIASRPPGAPNITYNGRCTGGYCALYTNGTLRMDNLTPSDNGTYTMTLDSGAVQVIERVQLDVYCK
ncbi:hypothetical protein GDO81_024337 [Engystomops pustulosus]|uniref:Immunoglobulin V-set domain-containing protein n=1 Tax=Engystomops pustulosus TaxID=76066 RepID=A0AAV6YLK7_ENGPU|nr:hypothetical protein GDO81_024337 [Engystomops pustulosus]